MNKITTQLDVPMLDGDTHYSSKPGIYCRTWLFSDHLSMVALKIEWWVLACLSSCSHADCLHMVWLMPLLSQNPIVVASLKSRMVFTFWYRLPGCPGKRGRYMDVKQLSIITCIREFKRSLVHWCHTLSGSAVFRHWYGLLSCGILQAMISWRQPCRRLYSSICLKPC